LPWRFGVEVLEHIETALDCECALSGFIGQHEPSGCSRRRRRQDGAQCGDQLRRFHRLGPAPRHHDDKPILARNAPRLGERTRGAGGILECVESGHEIEATVAKRQLLDITHLKLGTRHSTAGDGQQRRGQVDARDVRTPLRRALRGKSAPQPTSSRRVPVVTPARVRAACTRVRGAVPAPRSNHRRVIPRGVRW